MKKTAILFTALFFILSTSLIRAQEFDNHEFAKNILVNSLKVQAGEVILVNGGIHNMDLFEAFVIESVKLGAIVVPYINSDKIAGALYKNVPENYVGLYDSYLKEWSKLIDVFIFLQNIDNLKALLKDIPEKNIDKVNKGNQAHNAIWIESKIRGIYIPNFDKVLQTSDNNEQNIFFQSLKDAINVDHKLMAENAKKLEILLKNSKNIEVSSPDGTKISFSVTGRECFIDDGVVDEKEKVSKSFDDRWISIPTGNIYVSIIEDSGNGKVFVARDVTNWNDKNFIENLTFKVKKGKIQNFKIEKGEEAFMKQWNTYPEEINIISGLQIGLNPGIKTSEMYTGQWDSNSEGMVNILCGNNSTGGGKITSAKGAYLHPIINATLKIDGKVIIKDGKLMLD